MENFMEQAREAQRRAREIIRDTNVEQIWRESGAEIRLVGSLSMGLLMNHRDIDFHIYSSPVTVAGSFGAMTRLAEHPAIERIEYANLLRTPEACIEWHAWYRDRDERLWQLDMIHIEKGSRYDGYFERMAERISAALTDTTRETILRLKYQTPPSEKIMGIEYYRAVLAGGVRSYPEFERWREKHPVSGIVEWMP